jgi:hypothetical protein
MDELLDKEALALVIENAAQPIAQELTKELREQAKVLVDWAPYASRLEVVFEELRFRISAGEDPDIQQDLHKLEYGLLEVPPTPLLRPFQKEIEKAYKQLADKVSDVVVPRKRTKIDVLRAVTAAVMEGSFHG